MQEYIPTCHSTIELEEHGLTNLRNSCWNLPTPALYEASIQRNEGIMAHNGPLIVRTGQYTGRSPKDKFIVKDISTADKVWWGKENRSYDETRFDEMHRRMASYLQGKDVYVQDCWCGADPEYRIAVRIITQYAWHSLFARNMFIIPTSQELLEFKPDFVVIDCPGFHAFPETDQTNSDVFILINFNKKLVLIGGTEYAGEIKKSIFTAMNFYLPEKNVLPMHCSANYGSDGSVALFFGLSGTGKTTLSSDSSRKLIGDDEHGWTDSGVFNFEGGCYAKVIRLSPEKEPEIYQTTRRFGTILENVGINVNTRRVDLDDSSLTENTRASYPISHLRSVDRTGRAGHPKDIIFLTADAFGVLPPISRLSPEQTVYHFISGYTAKVAGTERGVTEPQATFSACFGAPFMALHPGVYAELLKAKVENHSTKCWLVNTGWTGGPYGVGHRIDIPYTRAMINAALGGQLDTVEYSVDPVFGLKIPNYCPGVPAELLFPRNTWENPESYDEQAVKLAKMFQQNFSQYSGELSEELIVAGPKVD